MGSGILGVLALATLAADPAVLDGDAQDVVFLGADRPVFVRLHLQVEGLPFRKLQPLLVEKLFDTFDADHDKVWTAAEQKAAADSGRLTLLGNDAAFDPKALDVNKNEKLDRDEFVKHALPALGPPILVRADPQSPTKSLPLFERLDEDEDGRVSAEEMRNAWTALRKMDLDDDELLSLTEMLPPDAPGQMPAPMPNARVDSPVVVITPDSIETLARTIVRRYNGRSRSKVPLKTFGLPEKALAPFDSDQDGEISRDEMKTLLASPPPHHEVLVKLPRGKKGQISLQTLGGRPTSGRLRVQSGSFATEISGASTRADVSDNRNFYLIKFRQGDADKNKYLSESEFGSLGLQASFEQVDRDGDKMVTTKEVLDFLAMDDQLNESRIELLISNEGKSLFELMDSSKDQRISPREFLEASGTLSRYDTNQDGKLDNAELDSRITLKVSLDRPKLFQQEQSMMRPAMTGRPPRPTTDAPAWFGKMDRNRDGDVSAREFLGPAAIFEKLDADNNGVLDPTEATAAEATAAKGE